MKVQGKFEIKGFEELIRNFRKINSAIQKEIIKKAGKEAAEPILQSAIQKVSVGENGTLANSIKVEQQIYNLTTHETIIHTKKAGTIKIWNRKTRRKEEQKGAPFYARWVEHGHFIVKGGRNRSGKGGGGKIVAKTQAKPFMRPAFEENIDKAEQIMADVIGRELKKFKVP